jgi:hypothetical protein
MNMKSNSETAERRINAGVFQWRESYTSSFEHFLESVTAAQTDYNNLTQKFSLAKTPYDFALAWSEFAQCRIAHSVVAFKDAVHSAGDTKSWIPRAK